MIIKVFGDTQRFFYSVQDWEIPKLALHLVARQSLVVITQN